MRLPGFAGATLLAAALVIAPAAVPFPAAVPVASAACPGAEVHMDVGSYGVNYPADIDPAKGANDMSAHVQSMEKHCPNTREVLGGYSLGAVSADLVVAVTKPGFGFKNPLPPGMDQNVAAVAMFGNGTRRILGPVPDFSPAFAGKTIDQCAAGDPICSSGTNWPSHLQPSYLNSGLVDQAASFAAARL